MKHAYLIIRLHLDIRCGVLNRGTSRGACSCGLLALQDLLHVRHLCSCSRHDIIITVSPIAVCARRHWCRAGWGCPGRATESQAGRQARMPARINLVCNPEPVFYTQQICMDSSLQTGLFPASSSCRAHEQARSAALTFARDVRGHLSQHSLQVCQRVPEGKPPAGCRTLAQVVCML